METLAANREHMQASMSLGKGPTHLYVLCLKEELPHIKPSLAFPESFSLIGYHIFLAYTIMDLKHQLLELVKACSCRHYKLAAFRLQAIHGCMQQ